MKKVNLSILWLLFTVFIGLVLIACPTDDLPPKHGQELPTVDAAEPVITTQPSNASYFVGDLILPLEVVANSPDEGTLSYQWYKVLNFGNDEELEIIADATSATYAPESVLTAEGVYHFVVIVTNTNDKATGVKTAIIESDYVQITMSDHSNAEMPNITEHPHGNTYIWASNMDIALLTVEATVSDGGTLSYQWYSNTTAANSGGTLLHEATGASYKPTFSTYGVFYYYVTVINTNNGASHDKEKSLDSSVATITINRLPLAAAPVISAQPVGKDYALGEGPVTALTVAATSPDGGSLSYQWYSNTAAVNSGGTLQPEATGISYIPPINTGTGNTYYYYVVVTNTNAYTEHPAGTTSEVARIQVGGWEYSAAWAAAFKAALPTPSYYNMQGEKWEWPDLYTFWDGSPVLTPSDWVKRYEEIKIILQHYLYGYVPPPPDTQTFTYNASARTISIAMTYQGNSATYTTGAITWPTTTTLYPTATGMPLSFGGNATYDGAKGYATMAIPTADTQINTLYSNKMAAEDYPGGLIRTAWCIDRIYDAIVWFNTQGNLGGMQNKIDPAKMTITGHSRGGKDAIVGAAFCKVPDMVSAPSSSGALGLAPERFIRTVVLPTNGAKPEHWNGKGYYYLSAARGSSSNTNATPRVNNILPVLVTGTEPPKSAVKYGPIQSIQNYCHACYDGTASGNFANGTLSTWPGQRMKGFTPNNVLQFYTSENGFQDKGSFAQVPFDQHYLAALMAKPGNPRAVIMTGAADGDSWIHPEGLYMIFLVTRQLYKWLGNYEDRVAVFLDTANGHTHTNFRRARQADLCEYVWKGTPLPTNTITNNTGFLQQGIDRGLAVGTGFEGLTGVRSPYPWNILNFADYQLITTAPPGQKSIAQITTEYFAANPKYTDSDHAASFNY